MIFMNSAGEFSISARISDPFLRKLNSKKGTFSGDTPLSASILSSYSRPWDINSRNEKESMANRGALSKILLDFFLSAYVRRQRNTLPPVRSRTHLR